MTEDPNVHPHWAAETKAIARNLARLDYFQVLGVTTEASHDELKCKYHQLLRNYHPDSFFISPDQELKEAVKAIAKRVTEAYVTLRNPQKRRQYTEDIQGPYRQQRLRYTEQRESEIRRDSTVGETTQGRQLWLKALAAIRAGNYADAERDLQTALIFEHSNTSFQAKLNEIRTLRMSQPPQQ
ncbi:MAG: J domain-containing protein [Myxococcales bacterium]|nr:J domain-containing protein [Myxococcales bacterium]